MRSRRVRGVADDHAARHADGQRVRLAGADRIPDHGPEHASADPHRGTHRGATNGAASDGASRHPRTDGRADRATTG